MSQPFAAIFMDSGADLAAMGSSRRVLDKPEADCEGVDVDAWYRRLQDERPVSAEDVRKQSMAPREPLGNV